MKIKLLVFVLLFSVYSYSQTTYSYGWWFDSTNQQISIEVGDTVEWTWGQSGQHNLIQLSGPETGFGDSTLFGPGHVYSHTFTTVGVNTYECSPHPSSMYGTITVNDNSASIDDQSLFVFNIYPNPAKDEIKLSFTNVVGEISVEVYDMLGRTNIFNKVDNVDSYPLDISKLKSGVYLITISSKDMRISKKFIKL